MKKLLTLMVLAAAGAFTQASAETWYLTWPVGGKAEAVDDVQVRCDDVMYRYTSDDATATLLDAQGNILKTLERDDIVLSLKKTYCTVDFEFDPALTTPGNYKISVPAGNFITNDQTTSSEAFEVAFAVEGSVGTKVDWNFTCVLPENGKANALEHIVLSSSKYQVGSVTADASGMLYDSKFNLLAELNSSDNLFAYEGKLMVALNPAITTPGSYLLVINANSVLNTAGDITNNVANFQLEVEASEPEEPAAPEYNVTAMPESGSKVSTATGGIPAFYVMIQGYSYLESNDSDISMTITKDGAPFATVDASVLSLAMDRTTLMVMLPTNAQMTQVGEYTVVMPAGFFLMKSKETDEIVDSPEITLEYTVTEAAEPENPLTWTVEPAPGTVSEIDVVTITFNKPVKMLLPYLNLFFTNSSYLPETVTEGALSVSEDGLVATVDFEPAFKDGGIYQIRIFEGNEQLGVVDGELFPGLDITYKVEAPLYAECTPEAGSTVDNLKQVKVKFPRNNKLSASDAFKAWFVKDETKIAAQLLKVGSYDFGDPAYVTVASNEEITEDGEWTLVIEAGSLLLSNYDETMESPEVSVKFVVGNTTGVNAIDKDANAAVKVYNMQGMPVSEDALTPGFYIRDGKKIRIR